MKALQNELLNEKDREQKMLRGINYAFNFLGSWEWNLHTNEIFWCDGTFNLKAAPVTSYDLPAFKEVLNNIHSDDKELVANNVEYLYHKKQVSFEYRKVDEEGELRVIKVWSKTVNDSNGEPFLFRLSSQDVTTERELTNSLEHKNKELEKSNNNLASFSYVASHDLQEPLRKIQTFSNRIEETEFEVLSEQGKNYFKRMVQAALRMQTLIDDLLTFSRTSNKVKPFETVDLNEMLEELKVSLKESLEEKQAIVAFKELPKIKAIPFQVKQLFENLLLNSLKYSKVEVPPQIEIASRQVGGVTSKITQGTSSKKYYAITVSDNGIGFEQQYAERIFELFQRLHGKHEYPGSGLGLSICKKVMENHQGFIKAESEPGKGSKFTVYFPTEV
jgi:signal transduction histidine kinase